MRTLENFARSTLGRMTIAATLYVSGVAFLVIGMAPILKSTDWSQVKLLVVLTGPVILLFSHIPLTAFVIGALIPFVFLELAVYSVKARPIWALATVVAWFGCGLLAIL